MRCSPTTVPDAALAYRGAGARHACRSLSVPCRLFGFTVIRLSVAARGVLYYAITCVLGVRGSFSIRIFAARRPARGTCAKTCPRATPAPGEDGRGRRNRHDKTAHGWAHNAYRSHDPGSCVRSDCDRDAPGSGCSRGCTDPCGSLVSRRHTRALSLSPTSRAHAGEACSSRESEEAALSTSSW